MHRDDLLVGRIDVLGLLRNLGEYVLIKQDDFFPRYAPGNDIDLVVYDRQESLQRFVRYYDRHLAPIGELRIADTSGHCQADFLVGGVLDVRVDLIDNFDFFQNIAVRPAYLTKLFLDRRRLRYGEDEVFVPSPEDDLTLRYFEYLEWFDRRPDKIKHLDYICRVEDEDLRQRFFANTHRFIEFKRKTWPVGRPVGHQARQIAFEVESRREAVRLMWRCLRYLVTSTIRKWKSL